jgi:uncharacterized protein YihD (DUF1040 family)
MAENQVSTDCHQNVIHFLTKFSVEKTYNQNYDIASQDVLTYKEMLLHTPKFEV